MKIKRKRLKRVLKEMYEIQEMLTMSKRLMKKPLLNEIDRISRELEMTRTDFAKRVYKDDC